jgi:hypothetical protein
MFLQNIKSGINTFHTTGKWVDLHFFLALYGNYLQAENPDSWRAKLCKADSRHVFCQELLFIHKSLLPKLQKSFLYLND